MNWLKDHIIEIIGVIVSLGGVIAERSKHPYAGYIIGFGIGCLSCLILVFLRNKFFNTKDKITYTRKEVVHMGVPFCYKTGTKQYYGVHWVFVSVSYGSSNTCEIQATPHCIKRGCDCELDVDRKKAKWVCPRGCKPIKIPKAIWEDPNDKVVKIFEADLKNNGDSTDYD